MGQLVEAGSEVDAKNLSGVTPLHKATNNGHLALIFRLSKLGADLNCVDMLGNTPLHYASKLGSEGIVKFLLENGARADMANR